MITPPVVSRRVIVISVTQASFGLFDCNGASGHDRLSPQPCDVCDVEHTNISADNDVTLT
jgi:hypothetical protein